MNPNLSFLLIVLAAMLIVAASTFYNRSLPSQPACDSFSPDACPSRCVVCPPCEVCSSIACRSEEFCAGLGFDRGWYEGMKESWKNLGG